MFIIFSVFYILIAAAMIVLILMQRGEGANAGASFGGGSSGTVFGARGSASFLSRATSVLAGLFFLLSLGMAVYLSHTGAPKAVGDLGVMSGVGTGTSQTTGKQTPSTTSPPATEVPSTTTQSSQPKQEPAGQASANSDIPTATVAPKAAGKAKSGQGQEAPSKDKN